MEADQVLQGRDCFAEPAHSPGSPSTCLFRRCDLLFCVESLLFDSTISLAASSLLPPFHAQPNFVRLADEPHVFKDSHHDYRHIYWSLRLLRQAKQHRLLLLRLPSPPPMEKPSTTAPYQSLALTEPIVLLFYKTVSIWFLLLQKISLQFVVFLRSRDEFPAPCASRIDEHAGKGASGDAGDALELTREDVEAVMEAMGIHRGSDGGDQLRERIAGAELSGLFEGEEPSLEEVEAAFAVFDDDRDGFIDAAELQRVLPKLGFREGLALEACRQMIAAYDENRDGRIDFDEFVKFMENSFC